MPDDGSLERIAALERTIERLRVQQALLDERLLVLERNRLFRWWNELYRFAARVYSLTGLGDRYGGLSDLRTPGDYQSWAGREEELPALASRPLISVRLSDGPGADASLQSLADQSYIYWKRVDEDAGEFVLTLHAGDRLAPHALHFYAQALADDSVATVYVDEDRMGDDGIRSDPIFKPEWSPELQRSCGYLGRGVLKRRGAQNGRTVHVPKVLYHRARSSPLEYTRPRYSALADARLSVVICSRELRRVRECVEAVRRTATVPLDLLVVHHVDSGSGDAMQRWVEGAGGIWIPYRGGFDFSRMNNLAATKATAPYLLFLNDDVIVKEPGWDTAMTATLARPEVGIAGVILQYPDATIQHAGVVVGMGDGAGHCGRFQLSSELWPWLRMTREVSAVTGAMLGIRADRFAEMRGFDGMFPVNYNDVDLCLRVRAAGLSVMCLDVGTVVHRESQTRVGGTRYQEREALYKRWADVLGRPDPFYSPNLAATERITLSSGMSPLRMLATRQLPASYP
jgi:GT2 family glycosyltransferase